MKGYTSIYSVLRLNRWVKENLVPPTRCDLLAKIRKEHPELSATEQLRLLNELSPRSATISTRDGNHISGTHSLGKTKGKSNVQAKHPRRKQD